MVQESIIREFEEVGALLEGHFVLTSGRHSDRFVSKDMVSSDPQLVARLAATVRDTHPDWQGEFDVVAAPAVGAIAFGSALGAEFGTRFAFAEANADKTEMVFGRGFAKLIKGKRVLIAEDIITRGKTVRQMIAAVEKKGGTVFAVTLLWLREASDIEGYAVEPLVAKTLPTWAAEDCQLCRGGRPITTEYNKHGQEFLDEFGVDPAGWPANRRTY